MRVRAFTLIELMVVVSIIALLVGILLPALGSARKHARTVACQSNVRQIAMASVMYAQDHDAWVGWVLGIDRKQLLYPYLKQGESNQDLDGNQVWHCPANDQPDEAAGYGFNTALNFVRLVSIRQPTHTVALCDSGIQHPGVATTTTMADPPSMEASGGRDVYRPNPRHPSHTVAIGFVDGHAAVMPMEMPFYPGPVDQWTGNSVTDPSDSEYKNQLWDLH